MPVLDIEKIYTGKEEQEEYVRTSYQLQWLQLSDPIRNLGNLFTFRNVEAILNFLREHPLLVNLLQEAYAAIEQSFGPKPEVFLELVADTEVQGLRELFGYIVSRLTPEEAGKRLQQFDRDWFLKQLPRAKGLLNFDVEFV